MHHNILILKIKWAISKKIFNTLICLLVHMYLICEDKNEQGCQNFNLPRLQTLLTHVSLVLPRNSALHTTTDENNYKTGLPFQTHSSR